MMRSIGAVLAGYVVTAVLVIAMFYVLGVFNPELVAGARPPLAKNAGWLTLLFVLGMIFAALGGYVTAALAARAPGKHAAALAVFMLAMSVVSAVMAYMQVQPFWFELANGAAGSVAALGGGALRVRRVPVRALSAAA